MTDGSRGPDTGDCDTDGAPRPGLLGFGDLRPLGVELALTACAVVFLLAYSYEVLARPRGGDLRITEIVLWTTWGAFAVDWVIAFARDRHKVRHRWEHLFGLLVVALPMFAPLRALRLLSLFVFLQRLLVRSPIRVTVLWYAAFSSALLIYVSSLAVLQIERGHPDSPLTDLPTALWWCMVTVTTVGYGDVTPVTGGGRLIAAVLMVSGIALLGVVTATLASWLVDRVAEETEQEEGPGEEVLMVRQLHRDVTALRTEIARLHTEITALRSGVDPDPGHRGDEADPPHPHQ